MQDTLSSSHLKTCPICHKNLKVVRPSAHVKRGEKIYCSQICAELDEPEGALAKSKSHRPFTR